MNNVMRCRCLKLVVGVISVFQAIWLTAEPVPVDNVVAAARGWLAITDQKPLDEGLGNGLKFLAPAIDDKGETLYYAVYLEKGGVVIMSPDDSIEPVIAFAPRAKDFDNPNPCNHLRTILQADLTDRLTAVKAGQVKDAAAKAGKWALLIAAAKDPQGVKAGLSGISDVWVPPMTASRWNQSFVYQGSTKLACYNYYTPPYTPGSFQNYSCGCVATALAQLMYYHKHPKTGIGKQSCTIQVNSSSYTRKLRGGNGYGGPYDWANMPADPGGLARAGRLTAAQRAAIGALCHDAAVVSRPNFSAAVTWAYMSWSAGSQPLQNVFKYANVATIWVNASSTYSKTDINRALNPSLDARMPAAIIINNNSGGGAHCVVVDGYGFAFGAIYHHLNMGWGGTDTAWYNLPSVKNVTISPYYRVTEMLFNLNPTEAGISVISGRTLSLAGKPLAGVRVMAKNIGGSYPNKATYSNSRGIYALKVRAGQWKVTPSYVSLGFKPSSVTVTAGWEAVRNSWANNFKAVTRIIRLSTAKLSFGTVAAGASKTLKFSIFNDGNAPLSVTGFSGPAGFSAAPSVPFAVPANGGKVVVSVTFAPAIAGFVKGDLIVKCNKSSGVNKLAVMGTGGPAISEMVLIPAGSFSMGDNFNEGGGLPVHTVMVSAFYMDRYEVTKALWDEVLNWSWTVGTGYSYNFTITGEAANHPVQAEDWFDILKWCNARSQKEGRTPVYYTDAGLTQIYKTGSSEPYVNWAADGYRLPTEAEWEKAARGGASDRRFPWSDADTIQHARANYNSSSSYPYDTSPTRGYHPAYRTDVTQWNWLGVPHTSPVGSFAPNGYGLYDMAGNVSEWCWDWYDGAYYSSSPGTDPRGPDAPSNNRVKRGGNYDEDATQCRSANRSYHSPYGTIWDYIKIGFRAVRNSP